MTCTAAARPTKGKVAVRTLAGADGKNFVEVGYDFAAGSAVQASADPTAAPRPFYVDHSNCCNSGKNFCKVESYKLKY